ncbi:MAG: hypothetical protein OEQ13_08990 [Acidobacteriota bacterium]|nr:hypothetical protein [Acidobacteriota bacterium]
MSGEPRDRIRQLLLQRLAGGRPVARAELLKEVARALRVPPERRELRTKVARALRLLEEEGRLVDAGPEVYLDGAADESGTASRP